MPVEAAQIGLAVDLLRHVIGGLNSEEAVAFRRGVVLNAAQLDGSRMVGVPSWTPAELANHVPLPVHDEILGVTLDALTHRQDASAVPGSMLIPVVGG